MSEYLNKFEENITKTLLKELQSAGFSNGQLLYAEELEEKWNEIAPEYMIDAVPQIASYPSVSIAWSAYVGMGVAYLWDKNWDNYGTRADLYDFVRGLKGFDYMDEHIIENILHLKLEGTEHTKIENTIRNCSHHCLDMIRRENIEPQSVDAFHIFARCTKAMFKIGVSLGLYSLGYKYEKMKVNLPS